MNTNKYVYAKTTTFLGKLIFSFRYSMVEVKYNNEIFYFIGFTHSNPNQNGDLIDIQKIGFKSFSLTDYHSTVPNALNINKYNRIVNLFVLENYTTLVLVYINRNNYLFCKFFNYNLIEQGSEINIGYLTMEHGNSNSRDKDGVFFKSVELPDNQRAFALFYNGIGDNFHFQIYKFSKNGNSFSTTLIISSKTSNYRFSSNIIYNDIHKINNNRIAVVSVSSNIEGLVLLLYDLYNNYQNLKRRWYYININGLNLNKELSLYTYNDYLMFTYTAGFYHADLLIFGYANGTDTSANIMNYLNDVDNNGIYLNSLSGLFNSLTIDNNIFGYTKMNNIKIISIPEEVKMYLENGDEKTEILNDTIIDLSLRYSFSQNKSSLKTYKYYDIYYQYMIKELEFNEFYNKAHKVDTHAQNNNNYNNYQNDFKATIFYGRTNKLSFKLCHNFCSKCYEMGVSINDQKCVSCLPEYTYDYWIYFNNTLSSNCVPPNYLNDIENKRIIECTLETNSKFYYNRTNNNSKICFMNKFPCPKEYP